ncbi:MAG: SurA N-terminal domain-containing protein [Candidatus Omnitrophica bacterium]|nr:SurA N-terminal domain-containing protein [Candidatus Omnitrophota bacterium]
MLKLLRNRKTAKKVWIVLAIIIIPAFTFWGFSGAFRGREESRPLGRIFGRQVSGEEFKDSLSAVTTAAIMRFGDKLPEVQKYLNLESQAWDRLVLLAEARKRNIKASDKEVIDLIESYPFFQYKGSFDEKIYNQTLQYVFRLQARAFEEQTRQSLILNKLYKQITDGLTVDDKEIAFAFDKENQQISIYYIAGIPGDFARGMKPAEKELKEYFAKNRLDFKQPASFNIEYACIASIEDAKKASGLLDKNGSLEKTAKDLKIELKQTGFFAQGGPVPGIEWLASTPEILSKLEQMKHSPPIAADGSYYILRVKDKKEAYIPEFEQVKQKVKDAFVNTEAWKIAEQKINQCAQELNKNPDLKQAAQKSGLSVKETAPFKFGAKIPELGPTDIFWENAKNLKPQEASRIIKAASGFYIIKVKTLSPRDEKKYAQEKSLLGQKILEQKKEESFNKFFEELKNKAR